MSEICSRVSYESIGAVYFPGSLQIWAAGKKPTPAHHVHVKHNPLLIYPPMYDLVACIKEGTNAIQLQSPYQIQQEIGKGFPESGFVLLNSAKGRERIPVFAVGIDLLEEQLSSTNTFSALGNFGDKGGDGMPSPFKLASVPGLFKSRTLFEKVFETGKSEDVTLPDLSKIKRYEATGHSASFIFEEAFQDAISQLPSGGGMIDFSTYHVESIDASSGGFVGITQMSVTVSTLRFVNEETNL